jgi:hypothetical protein
MLNMHLLYFSTGTRIMPHFSQSHDCDPLIVPHALTARTQNTRGTGKIQKQVQERKSIVGAAVFMIQAETTVLQRAKGNAKQSFSLPPFQTGQIIHGHVSPSTHHPIPILCQVCQDSHIDTAG